LTVIPSKRPLRSEESGEPRSVAPALSEAEGFFATQ